MEDARLLGPDRYLFEAGACVVLDGEEHWMTAPLLPQPGERGSIHDQIEDAGAAALLLERYPGRLEYHDPWHRNREVSHLFAALWTLTRRPRCWLAKVAEGYDCWTTAAFTVGPPTLPISSRCGPATWCPSGPRRRLECPSGIRARGYDPARCIAIGDSREDLQTAAHVGEFWLVANGLTKDPSIGEALAAYPNARVAEGANGAGVYEAVVDTLARRGS